MALAIILIAIVIAAVLFNIYSPWWLTPLASNWGQIDFTFNITMAITGFIFVVVNIFIAYAVIRFRQRGHQRAEYEPDSKKLELWLVGFTSIGIAAMLAPGLLVYADYIHPPPQVAIVEVVGQQWQWSFRYPGKSGLLGVTDPSLISPTNPFGLNPDDPNGRDNILVSGPEMHLQLNQPVQLLLRSKDVLHDFYVPPFRARMNLVPGMITRFWFTPTRTGRYEVLCAQLCGVGHYNMRAYVVVEDKAAFDAWLSKQPTFEQTLSGQTPSSGLNPVALGKALAQSKGCVACHSANGTAGVGPTWQGLYGMQQQLETGTAKVDENFLREAIIYPNSKRVKGFQPVMPKIPLDNNQVSVLIAYIKSLSGPPAGGVAKQ